MFCAVEDGVLDRTEDRRDHDSRAGLVDIGSLWGPMGCCQGQKMTGGRKAIGEEASHDTEPEA